MEVYRAETKEILRRFAAGHITYQQSLVALNAALAGFLPAMNRNDLEEVQSITQANNRILDALRCGRRTTIE
jgi:hypothetical protein